MDDEHRVRATGWARSLPLDSRPAEARAWTRRHLTALGWTASAPDAAEAVVLTVSELVTNAHRHAHSSAQLILTWDSLCLHVSVYDSSSALPETREPDQDALGGRGMFLVDALADDWEVRPCPRGKSVTACFRPDIPAEPASSAAHRALPTATPR